MRAWTSCPAWREAGPSARVTWLHLRLADPIGRNEPVNAGVRRLAAETGLAVGTVQAALKELIALGFVESVTDGIFARADGEKLARTVRASFEFLKWRPSKNISPVTKSERDRIDSCDGTAEMNLDHPKKWDGPVPFGDGDRIEKPHTSMTMLVKGRQVRDATGKRITAIGRPLDPNQAELHRRAADILKLAGGGRRLADASGLDRGVVSRFGRGEQALRPDQVRRLELGLALLESDTGGHPAPGARGGANAA